MRTEEITFIAGAATRPAFLALPESGTPAPGIVVIHEAFGLNENIREVSRRFAEIGYAALAVDLLAGRNRAVCMFRLMSGVVGGSLERYGMVELRAALDHLANRPEVDPHRLGSIGFCMGGSFAIAWACTDPRLKVIAPFYGANPRPLEAVARLCPVVGSYPGKDFTTGHGRKLDSALDAYGVPHDIKVYEGAKHSFFNDRGGSHDADAASDAWARVTAFFAEHLTVGGASA